MSYMHLLAIPLLSVTGNTALGGLIIGTTAGATDVLIATSVPASKPTVITDNQLSVRAFSATADTTLYIQTSVGWNSANVDIVFDLRKFTV